MTKQEQQELFMGIYHQEADSLFRFVSFRIAQREIALDIVQDVYMKFWSALQGKLVIENARAYLYKIARNRVIDEYRKKNIDTVSLDHLMKEDGFDTPVVRNVSEEQQIDIRKALTIFKNLPVEYQEPLWLRIVEEWPVKEIASFLNESENLVSVRIHRGKKILHRLLEEKNI